MPVYLLKRGPLERTKILKVDGDIQVTLKPMLSFEKIALSPFTWNKKGGLLAHALYLLLKFNSHMTRC